MSNFDVSLLGLATQQVVIYVGFFLFIAGLIGCTLTLIVFVSLRTFRESSCAFYLIAMSIVNIFHLFTGLLTFIMINGFAINWSDTSLFYCKFRSFYVQLCILTSFTCMSLAAIDQFLATCSQPRWQQWCNLKSARSYRNVQQIAYRTVPLVRRELDKQLTVIVLVHVFYDVIVVMPSIIDASE
ncbi:unnamed protein product [Rotaria sordida]|uniref:G-protein coupled receptors family 1 profile domain-containing protein n=1 Tax=Rotaria sordida TaxID=392033 RepID=A0A815R3T4_9BILA|nr:unnamed protein product [Rotaria sordida]CAF1544918.1 unnamed protein product [Rotaria sordida]